MPSNSSGKTFDLGGFARTIGEVGLPILGGLVGGPGGAAIAKQIADRLGKRSEEEAERAIAERDPQALVELKKIQLETLRAELAKEEKQIEADTRTVEAVNATMQAEVAAMISNPAAGAWRPLWGRRSCYAFEATIYSAIISVLFCVVTGKADVLAQLPIVFGALLGLFGLPAAILGVASWKRGDERKALAGGVSAFMESRSTRPSVRAVPVDGLPDPSTLEGKIFKRNS